MFVWGRNSGRLLIALLSATLLAIVSAVVFARAAKAPAAFSVQASEPISEWNGVPAAAFRPSNAGLSAPRNPGCGIHFGMPVRATRLGRNAQAPRFGKIFEGRVNFITSHITGVIQINYT